MHMTEARFKPRTRDAAFELCGWMFEHDVSSKRLAIEIGVSLRALTNWRNGHSTPSLKRAIQLESITGGRVPAKLWST